MHITNTTKRAVVGLITAVALVFALTGCHNPDHTTIDKTYAVSEVQTGTFDADLGSWVTVEVTNKHTHAIRIEIDVEDGVARQNAVFVLSPGTGSSSFTPFGSPSNMDPDDPDYAGPPIQEGPNVDVWIKVSSTVDGRTLEWHHHDNIQWDPDPATPGWG